MAYISFYAENTNSRMINLMQYFLILGSGIFLYVNSLNGNKFPVNLKGEGRDTVVSYNTWKVKVKLSLYDVIKTHPLLN